MWDERSELAFEKLKTLLTEVPVLTLFDLMQTLSLYTDASGLGLGAVLYQGINQYKRVLYLNRAEERRKFSITGNAQVNGYARRSSARF